MKLALIVAAATNNVIGLNNQLPWHLPQDLKYFKAKTLGKPIVMGRKTYESIGRPLPGRTNIVITRQLGWRADPDVLIAHNIDQALELARDLVGAESDAEVMVIGGAEIYRNCLPQADRVYLTRVEKDVEGDAYFPSLPEGEWQQTSSSAGVDDAPIQHQFLVFDRVSRS